MADQKITDLTLPLAVIQRLIKEALPPNAIAKNEAKLGVSKAASVFILFLTSGKLVRKKSYSFFYYDHSSTATTDITSSKNQKTMTADHVIAALKDIEFDHLIPELESSLSNYRQVMKNKKDRKSVGNTEKATEEDATEDIEMIDE